MLPVLLRAAGDNEDGQEAWDQKEPVWGPPARRLGAGKIVSESHLGRHGQEFDEHDDASIGSKLRNYAVNRTGYKFSCAFRTGVFSAGGHAGAADRTRQALLNILDNAELADGPEQPASPDRCDKQKTEQWRRCKMIFADFPPIA